MCFLYYTLWAAFGGRVQMEAMLTLGGALEIPNVGARHIHGIPFI